MNYKSLSMALLLGLASWFWAFIIVGSAFFDYTTNQPIENPNIGVYITMLVIDAIITITVLTLYLRSHEQHHPIAEGHWLSDALLLGVILCGVNFLLDAIFFGMMGRNLIAYFWLESTTGYFYPLFIPETAIIAYLIYGKDA